MMTEGWAGASRAVHWVAQGDDGPTIVMLHEMGGSSRSFDGVVAQLADIRCRIVRIDQRGFGLSEKPRTPYDFKELADDVAAVLDAIGVTTPVCLVGVASACAIATDFAIRFPARVSRLLLCAPAIELPEAMRQATRERAQGMLRAEMAAIASNALAAMYPETIRGPEFAVARHLFLANDPVGFGLASEAFAGSDIKVDYLSQPCLLLAGTHDLRTVEQIEALAARMPEARVAIVDDAGHMMAVQAPAAVARHARTFFSLSPD